MKKVRCIKNVETTSLTVGKEYVVIEVEPQGYKIINNEDSIRRYHKSLFEEVEETKAKTWAQEAIEHAEKETTNNIKKIFDESLKLKEETRCYNKECSGNEENQCIVTGRVCISRATEPINYEEEYYKLKNRNTEYFIQWGEAESKVKRQEREIEELKRLHDNQRLNIKSEMSENRELKSKIIELEKENNSLKSNINLLSKCEENESLKAIIKSLASIL